jgi:transposase
MPLPFGPDQPFSDPAIEFFTVKHLPIVKSFIDRIGMVEVINQLVPCQMEEEPGIIFSGLILDTLSGRTPLYRLDEFFRHQDLELLLGRKVKPESFADYNVARLFDKVYQIGTMKIFTAIAKRAVLFFNVAMHRVGFDTTSVSVWGDYADYDKEAENTPFKITHGHSKDQRPDLKQFLIAMLCVEGGIPIHGQIEDGHGSDKKINNGVLGAIGNHMARFGLEPGAFIYVADAAMVTEANLALLGEDIHFISRLPATYSECGRVIKAAVKEGHWEKLGALSRTPSSERRPAARYQAHEKEVLLYGRSYRAVVIHSSAHDQRRQKRLERELQSERARLEKDWRALGKKDFFCEADARAALKALAQKASKGYTVEAAVQTLPKYKKGRPKGGVRQIESMGYGITFQIHANSREIEALRQEAGCFVLITNLAEDGEGGMPAGQVLKEYKNQHGIEQNFGFLKNPAIVNAIFLKKAERIEVLGLVLLLALLIWRLMEHVMRKHVAQTGTDLPGWKKRRTKCPTAFMLVTKFSGIMVMKVGTKRMFKVPLSSQHKEYLRALKVSPEAFLKSGIG